jgi:hypothetical protein
MDIHTHTHTHTLVHRHTESIYLNGPHISFFLFEYFVLFHFILGFLWVSTLRLPRGVFSFYFILFFSPSLFSFYKLITLREIIRWGKRRAQRKRISNEEFRHELAIIALGILCPWPLSLSLSFLYLFIYIFFFLFLSLLYVFPSAFLSLSFLLLCKKYIYLYIWLIPSSLHTDTTHNYSSQWLVIISKATQLPLFLTGPFALVEWNGS